MNLDSLFSILAQVSISPPDPWSDKFLGLDGPQRFSLLIVGIGCLTGVIVTLACIISSVVSKAHQRRIEAELKREMLDRGMSAEEVARVIEATAPDEMASNLKAIYGRK